jgi:hypothetical protein
MKKKPPLFGVVFLVGCDRPGPYPSGEWMLPTLGNGYLGSVYSKILKWISTSLGRKRYNVLGTMNMGGKN